MRKTELGHFQLHPKFISHTQSHTHRFLSTLLIASGRTQGRQLLVKGWTTLLIGSEKQTSFCLSKHYISGIVLQSMLIIQHAVAVQKITRNAGNRPAIRIKSDSKCSLHVTLLGFYFVNQLRRHTHAQTLPQCSSMALKRCQLLPAGSSVDTACLLDISLMHIKRTVI